MFSRSLIDVVQRLSVLYPVVGITGPRQSGKTTLAQSHFSSLPYVSLEDLDTRLRATEDPKGFFWWRYFR
jgi:uncharacterized protein